MDHQAFDRFAKRFSAVRSRREAVLAALGGVLMAGIASDGSAKPGGKKKPPRPMCRKDDCKAPFFAPETRVHCCAGRYCSCDGRCCEDRCFWGQAVEPETGHLVPVEEFCCVGPKYVFCPTPGGKDGDGKCCLKTDEDPCGQCIAPSGIVASIRRPR
jgi:hypothetical protein